MIQKLNKDNLPTPEVYYHGQNLKFKGTGEWRSAICPFHDDTKPSLRINIKNGAFKCMVCHTKGGDIIEFHKKKYNLNFKEALNFLLNLPYKLHH